MAAEQVAPLTELERDALAELSNIAMARAATSLRQMVQTEVVLSVPSVQIMAPDEAVEIVARPGNPNLVAVRQDFSGPFSGRALLIFPEATSWNWCAPSSGSSSQSKTWSIWKSSC